MLSWLRQIGIGAVGEDSSGNGGAAIAAFGAAAGMAVTIFAPAYASPAKIAQIRLRRRRELVDGPREASQDAAIRASGKLYYASHNWQPFFLQGTKSIAYEMWEDFGFEAPDNVVIPAGAGSNVLGCAIGFAELLAAGQIRRLPRLFVAQPLHCSPVDASFQAGADTLVERPVLPTVAEGTAIRQPCACAKCCRPCAPAAGRPWRCPRMRSWPPCASWPRWGSMPSRPARRPPPRSTCWPRASQTERTVVLLTGRA